ncbi:MAG: RluA family pseudouridine synthase [bacterium]|nr:RluA family pseudouridine synthase [bacterium]
MLEPKVIYEEKDFVAVNKPAGLLVHEARILKRETDNASSFTIHDSGTLVDWLLKNYPEVRNVGDDPKTRPGIVHRLDKDTSGIMLVARSQSGFEYLKGLFKERKIKKTYLALVYGEFKDGRGIIDRPLGIKSGTTKRSVHSDKMAKEAVTEYKVIRSIGGNSLLEVCPRTGRTHQIRVHLASIGHPIVGDRLYGSKKLQASSFKLHDHRLMLHALSLEFVTPDGNRLKIEAGPEGEEWAGVVA